MTRAQIGILILVATLFVVGSTTYAQSSAQNSDKSIAANAAVPVANAETSNSSEPKSDDSAEESKIQRTSTADVPNAKQRISTSASPDLKPGSAGGSPAPIVGTPTESSINTIPPPTSNTVSPIAVSLTPTTIDNDHKRLAASPMIIRTQAFLVPPLLQERGIRQQPHQQLHGFRGWLAKLFSPLISPLANGLEDTSYSLNATTTSLYSLQPSLNSLSVPLTQLAEPLSGLSQPMTGLQQPISDLRAPILHLGEPISGLQQPVAGLSRSAASLREPMNGLARNLTGLQQPLSGISQPLLSMRQPLEELPKPLHELVPPLHGLVAPLNGLQSPLNGVAGGLNGLQGEMHDLRLQIEVLQQSILDIGRNVTLAIVFGSCVIAYAIWTHRKVPSVTAPTVSTVEGDSTEHGGRQTIKTRTTEAGEPTVPPQSDAGGEPHSGPGGQPPAAPPTDTFRPPLE